MNPSFILKKLSAHQDKKYQFFMQKLIPNCHEIMGVRMPILKKIAKECGTIPISTLKSYQPKTHEEKMVLALIIANSVKTPDQFDLIKAFIPYIDNWAVCDTFCTYLKVFKTYQKEGFTLIEKLVRSSKEYKIRVGYVLLLFYFITDDYIDKIFSFMDEFKSKDYYAKMAVAWCLSICFVYDEEKTTTYLLSSKLDTDTFNKSIDKIIQSRQVSLNKKNFIRLLKF